MPQEQATYLATLMVFIRIDFGNIERSKIRNSFSKLIEQYDHSNYVVVDQNPKYFIGCFTEELADGILKWIAENKIVEWGP
jgi:hypothetical protein